MVLYRSNAPETVKVFTIQLKNAVIPVWSLHSRWHWILASMPYLDLRLIRPTKLPLAVKILPGNPIEHIKTTTPFYR